MQRRVPVDVLDHAHGPADALITLVENGNYECSQRRRAAKTVRDLQVRFGGGIRLIYQHFPRVTMYSFSVGAAEVAEAASNQGKFWQMHEALLAQRDTLSEGSLLACASGTGLDIPQFLYELEADTHKERVKQDFQSGVGSGVAPTPTFFINGKRHDDLADQDLLHIAIQQLSR